MRIAIFSDVHGNLPALELFVKETRSEVSSYLCLGDVVNYGPWSNECVDLVASLPNVTYLKGNHEDYFNTPSAILRELELVQIFFNHTFPMFDRHEIIKHLPEQVKIDTYIATHTINNLRIYENTDIEINNNFIIGHSHYQFIRKVNNYTIFNPGSLGQNRKNIKIANYAVYDTDQKKFDLRGFEYDTAPLFRAMKNQKYPQACIDYYVSKITS